MKLLYILIFTSSIYSMEDIHIKTQSDKHGSDSDIVIHIKDNKKSKEQLIEEKKLKMEKVKIAAVSGIASAFLTAIVTLIIHFTECK